jgi:NADPH-dependent glutamate synthase beta subunit-like oxidoreductase
MENDEMASLMQEDVLRGLLSRSETALTPLVANGNRIRIRQVLPSPCAAACPAGVNIKGYVGLIAAGRFGDALELVRQDNPLPGICGRVCHHPCEAHCKRSESDDPVAIRWLKRFVADYELEAGRVSIGPLPPTKKQKIAIVGSGPAGLTVANDLVRLGYGVSIFEAHSEPGGMLASAIPAYLLLAEILRTEIDAIVELGVEIRRNMRIGVDLSLDELFRKAGYSAIFIGVGAQIASKMEIPGEAGDGVIDCLTFLRRINSGDRCLPGRRVVVVGGGHSALDCAQSAIRLGAEDVQVVYRRSPDEMPADLKDVREAEAEGVRFTYLTAPVQIRRVAGQVVGLVCVKNKLGPKDPTGRRRPEPVAESEFELPVDAVISAVGQQVDPPDLIENSALELSQDRILVADEYALSTGMPGVFAGGDAVTGPAMAIDAIGQGHRATGLPGPFIDTLWEKTTKGPVSRSALPVRNLR